MIEKLLEILKECWAALTPFFWVFPWQGGVILRWGKYSRTIACGPHWKWPVWEDFVIVDTCVTTMRLPPQSLTTKDDRDIVISSVIKYQIKDPKTYVCEILDQKDVLADTTMGAIATMVEGKTYTQLRQNADVAKILDTVRKEVNRYGFRIHRITFKDKTKAKSIRLMTDAVEKDLDN